MVVVLESNLPLHPEYPDVTSQQSVQRRQLSQLPQAAAVAFISLGVVLLIAIFMFYPLMSFFGVFAQIDQILDTSMYQAYIAASVVGLGMLLTAISIENDETSEDDTSKIEETDSPDYTEISSWDDFVAGAKQLYHGFGGIAYLSILVGSGVMAAMVVSTYISPAFGAAVAVAYPVLDLLAYQRINHPLTPASLAMFPTLPIIVLATVFTIVVSLAIGFVVGIPMVILQTLADVAPVSSGQNFLRKLPPTPPFGSRQMR
jgi:hypothetical protein